MEPSTDDWMRRLAQHHAHHRAAAPDERLLLVFDIDGTILDMRHMVGSLLTEYDRAHGTHLFDDLRPEDVDVHENQVHRLLAARHLAPSVREDVHRWYLQHRWTPRAVLEAHRPFRGVMEVIRWFQLQPSTYVGLNTGRPEALRAETLRSLNALGREYRVSFDDHLLHMNPGGWEEGVPAAKVAALEAFRADGYRVLAAVDNEPAMIRAMAEADTTGDVLFLHARTLYESQRVATPRTVDGEHYDLRSLIGRDDLPRHVQIVWHGVDDPAHLRQFLASPVRWGAVAHGRLGLGHRVQGLHLDQCLAAFRGAGKSAKLDVRDAADLDRLLVHVADSGLDDEDLWFEGRIDTLGEPGLRSIAIAHPGAVVQCPVDFLGPLAVAAPGEAKRLVDLLAGWGVNRFSVRWGGPHVHPLLDRLDEWGCEANIDAVADLEQFLRAVLLLPRSITADVRFPAWHWFGEPLVA